jgi:anhydro-N-acetylmuramic acid kinase
MSGTSLDGLDLAYCEFREHEGSGWDFEIKYAETKPYSDKWHSRLQNAPQLSGLELSLLNAEYGHYTGKCIKAFAERYGLRGGLQPHFAAVHGHTVFHQPARGLTLPIGDGAAIAAECGLPVITQFRTSDVALGGQGAPLVPIGDTLLFEQYDYRLNLGGIANISYKAASSGAQTAFDVCPCNMALNYLAGIAGLQYDKDGKLARTGSIDQNLLDRMNALPFYSTSPPKSLGTEWFEAHFKPLLTPPPATTNDLPYTQPPTISHATTLITTNDLPNTQSPTISPATTPTPPATTNDLLATTVEHIALQIANTTQTTAQNPKAEAPKMLITGGGALNTYLMERIRAHTSVQITQSPEQLIKYKEALIFAFLGVLRIQQRPNALASVTGAKKDNIGGCIFLP